MGLFAATRAFEPWDGALQSGCPIASVRQTGGAPTLRRVRSPFPVPGEEGRGFSEEIPFHGCHLQLPPKPHHRGALLSGQRSSRIPFLVHPPSAPIRERLPAEGPQQPLLTHVSPGCTISRQPRGLGGTEGTALPNRRYTQIDASASQCSQGGSNP